MVNSHEYTFKLVKPHQWELSAYDLRIHNNSISTYFFFYNSSSVMYCISKNLPLLNAKTIADVKSVDTKGIIKNDSKAK